MPKPLLAAFAVLLLLIGGFFGFGVGAGKAQPRWYTSPAHVSVEAKKASFQTDGWTYGFEESVAWFDGEGTFHESGWPECLTDRTTSATFLAPVRTIDVDGTGIRPVLAVDCRG